MCRRAGGGGHNNGRALGGFGGGSETAAPHATGPQRTRATPQQHRQACKCNQRTSGFETVADGTQFHVLRPLRLAGPAFPVRLRRSRTQRPPRHSNPARGTAPGSGRAGGRGAGPVRVCSRRSNESQTGMGLRRRLGPRLGQRDARARQAAAPGTERGPGPGVRVTGRGARFRRHSADPARVRGSRAGSRLAGPPLIAQI